MLFTVPPGVMHGHWSGGAWMGEAIRLGGQKTNHEFFEFLFIAKVLTCILSTVHDTG